MLPACRGSTPWSKSGGPRVRARPQRQRGTAEQVYSLHFLRKSFALRGKSKSGPGAGQKLPCRPLARYRLPALLRSGAAARHLRLRGSLILITAFIFFYDLSSRRAERPDSSPSRVGGRGGVVRANLTLRSRRSSSPRVCPRTRSAGPEPRVWSLPGAHQGVPLRLPGLPRTAGLARVPGHARRRCVGGRTPNIHALHNGAHLMTLRL